jgi:hypothetical protein
MTPANDDWMSLLRDAVARSSRQAVADTLEVSRTTVSLVLSGRYLGKTDRVAARVIRVLGQIRCPYNGAMIAPSFCHELTARRPPINNPSKLSNWRTCQSCPHHPTKGAKDHANDSE